MRAVIDTATLVSAIRSDAGASAEIIRRATLRDFIVLADLKLICEYREVGLRREHITASGKKHREVSEMIDLLESISIPVFVAVKIRPMSPDPDDDMVTDVAINGSADAVVTNNVKHFTLASERFGIEVLTPKDFLMRLKTRVRAQPW